MYKSSTIVSFMPDAWFIQNIDHLEYVTITPKDVNELMYQLSNNIINMKRVFMINIAELSFNPFDIKLSKRFYSFIKNIKSRSDLVIRVNAL